MRGSLAMLALAAALAAAPLAGAVPAQDAAVAAQDDPRLDRLFAQLKAAPADADTEALTDQIWRIWVASGRSDIDDLMTEGTRSLNLGDLPKALDRFAQIVARAPDFAEGWNKRATVYYLLGNFDASVADIERTLVLEPRHFGALSGLGLIYMSLGKEQAALRAFRKTLDINPHLPAIRERVDALTKKLKGEPI
jgi:tetratricopeptide (TPR) repeat protein